MQITQSQDLKDSKLDKYREKARVLMDRLG